VDVDMDMDVVVWVYCSCGGRAPERKPCEYGQCSHFHMDSLRDSIIGDAGARDLGAALRVNSTLTTL
jgi:hypothetical protein